MKEQVKMSYLNVAKGAIHHEFYRVEKEHTTRQFSKVLKDIRRKRDAYLKLSKEIAYAMKNGHVLTMEDDNTEDGYYFLFEFKKGLTKAIFVDIIKEMDIKASFVVKVHPVFACWLVTFTWST